MPIPVPKRLWWFLGIVLALPPLAAALLYLFISPEKLRPVVEKQLSDGLQRQVGMGELKLSLAPLALIAADLSIKESPDFGAGDFARVKHLELHAKFLPLLRGEVEISRLTLHEPSIELRQAKSGTWNWESLGRQSAGTQDQSGSHFAFDRLELLSATMGVTDRSGDREEYRRLNLRIKGYSKGRPFTAALSAATEQGAEVGLDGTIIMTPETAEIRAASLYFAGLRGTLAGKIYDENLDLVLEFPSSPIAQAAPLFIPAGTKVQGQVSAKLAVGGTIKAPAASGSLSVQDFAVEGGGIQTPVKTERLNLQFTPERITVAPAQVVSGATQIRVEGALTDYSISDVSPRLQLSISAPNAQLEELLSIAVAYGVKSLSSVKGSGKLQLSVNAEGSLAKNQALRFSGHGAARQLRIDAPDLNRPLPIDSALLRFADNAVDCEGLAAQIGSSRLTGSFRVENFATPRATFDLNADQVLLQEFQSLFPEQKSSAKPPQISAEGNITIGKLDLETVLLEQVRTRVNLRNQKFTLSPLTAKLYGGIQSGSLIADLSQQPPHIRLDSRLQDVESGALLAAATSVRGFLSGPLASQMNVEFSAGEPQVLTRSLTGKLSLDLRKGQLGGINLTNEIASIAKFLGYQPAAFSLTEIVSLTGDLALTQGKVSTDNLELRLPNLVAAVDGDLDLNAQTMRLKIVNVLEPSFAEQVGGNRIGAFLTSALAGPQGSLIIPITLEGSFQNPRASPDPAAVARLKLESLSPSNPEAIRRGVDSVLGIFRKKQ